jgi:hypothetical protein
MNEGSKVRNIGITHTWTLLSFHILYARTVCFDAQLWTETAFTVSEVEVEVILRLTVSRPVRLGVRRPSGTRDQFFFLLEMSFKQLRVCYFVSPSLTRGRACKLLVQLLLGLARAVTLGSKSRRTHGDVLLSPLRLPQSGGPGPRI